MGTYRSQYVTAQRKYFKFFIHNYDVKNDPDLYDYRRRIKSELQYLQLRNLPYPIIMFGIVYGLIRTVKSGRLSAIICAAGTSLFSIHSIYNMSGNFAFELSYPAHPLVKEQREEAIKYWWYHDPNIIKYELEYLGKKVHKDGYARQFESPKGHKYEIAVDEGETYINWVDNFEDIFEFSQDALKDNKLMDMLSPEDFESHKNIVSNMFQVYQDFADEYLKQEYKPRKAKLSQPETA